MTLFGGNKPQHDLHTGPDCMTPHVYEDMLHGYEDIDAYTAAETPESVFAWVMLNINFLVVREIRA